MKMNSNTKIARNIAGCCKVKIEFNFGKLHCVSTSRIVARNIAGNAARVIASSTSANQQSHLVAASCNIVFNIVT